MYEAGFMLVRTGWGERKAGILTSKKIGKDPLARRCKVINYLIAYMIYCAAKLIMKNCDNIAWNFFFPSRLFNWHNDANAAVDSCVFCIN